MDRLRITLVQSDIVWEERDANLRHFGDLVGRVAGESDLVVLPETFSTGFSVHATRLAETTDAETMQTVRSWSKEFRVAVCGSFISTDGSGRIYNRGFFITPEGDARFYDKRHLFRMGEEHDNFSAGSSSEIISFLGWNIRLIICYDLRFPVWIRNRRNEYDLLLCVANWPASRNEVWSTLLKARALENQCYVCGVNRIGEDFHGLRHQGDSVLIDFKGKIVEETPRDREAVVTAEIDKISLENFRNKFPVWKDSDDFYLRIP